MNQITKLKIKKLYGSNKYNILNVEPAYESGIKLLIQHNRTNKEYTVYIGHPASSDTQSIKQYIHTKGLV